MSKFQPMLGAPVDFTKLQYPVLCSLKLDGIRCIVNNAYAYPLTRTLKPVPNQHIKLSFEKADLCGYQMHGLDGELIVGKAWEEDVFNKTTSGVMSQGGKPNFTYCVFDIWQSDATFKERQRLLLSRAQDGLLPDWAEVVPQELCLNEGQVRAYEEYCISIGYEGIIVRDPNARYKFGRSTVREGGLLKLKRWEDAEGEVIGTFERMINCNEQITDERGYAKRSTHQSGKIPAGDLGGFKLRILSGKFAGQQVEVGSGFTSNQRVMLWREREAQIGHIVTFKYFPVGSIDRPRHPIFKGFRED